MTVPGVDIEPTATGVRIRAHPGLCEGWGNCHRWGPEVYPLDEELLGGLPSMSHLSARQEYRQLLDALRLPISERAAARNASPTVGREARPSPSAIAARRARSPAGKTSGWPSANRR